MSNKRAHPLVYALVTWFAAAAWLSNFSTFIQLPTFSQKLPERWNIASIVIVTVQASSLGPIVFMLLERVFKIHIRYRPVILACLVVIVLVQIPLILAWDVTTPIFGVDHSIVLLGCMFVQGVVAIGSDVVWLPWMSTISPAYTPAYFVGVGLSGLIPSLLNIAQGSASYTCEANPTTGELEPNPHEPRFSVSVFYCFVLVSCVGSLISYYLISTHLHWLESVTCFSLPPTKEGIDIKEQDSIEMLKMRAADGLPAGLAEIEPTIAAKGQISQAEQMVLLICICAVGGQMMTIVPSVQSFASLPYSQSTYFWINILCTIVSPISAFVSGFVVVRRTIVIVGLTILATACTVMTIIIGLQSPHPWGRDALWGSLLTGAFQVIGFILYPFVRTCATQRYTDIDQTDESRLFYSGLSTQIGAAMGVALMFPSINVFDFFIAPPAC